MTLQISPKSTQHTGMALSTQGSVAAWEVTFHLDGDDSLHAAVNIRLAGPPTHHEARQKALKILQVFQLPSPASGRIPGVRVPESSCSTEVARGCHREGRDSDFSSPLQEP
jgi:hypothetical protein